MLFLRRIALLLLCCFFIPSTATAKVVISQIYGLPESNHEIYLPLSIRLSAKRFQNCYVALLNSGNNAESLDGLYLDYAPLITSVSGPYPSYQGSVGYGSIPQHSLALSNVTLQPGQSYLVSIKPYVTQHPGNRLLPPADQISTLESPIGIGGTYALATKAHPNSITDGVLDYVGYGYARPDSVDGTNEPGYFGHPVQMPEYNGASNPPVDYKGFDGINELFRVNDTGDNSVDFAFRPASPINSAGVPEPSSLLFLCAGLLLFRRHPNHTAGQSKG